MIATEENPINFPVKLSSNLTLFTVFLKRKKKDFRESVENNAEILDKKSDENRRINASILTTRSYPHQLEKNQIIFFKIFHDT